MILFLKYIPYFRHLFEYKLRNSIWGTNENIFADDNDIAFS